MTETSGEKKGADECRFEKLDRLLDEAVKLRESSSELARIMAEQAEKINVRRASDAERLLKEFCDDGNAIVR